MSTEESSHGNDRPRAFVLGADAPLGKGFSLGGGVAVGGTDEIPDALETVKQLKAERVPGQLTSKDPTLWGPEAESEASIRLGWLDLPRTSRDLLPELEALTKELASEGLDRVVLAGMGGSSLAPEVITRTLGVPLTVLDTTDPQQVRAALSDDLDHTVVVVSSKSGSTIETDSHRRAFWQAFRDAGMTEEETGKRFVVVTDPGSPLETAAIEWGVRKIFLADPQVGGRYSALSAFGLVPAALAGVNVAELLDQASALLSTVADGGPALALGAALGAAAKAGRDKLVLSEDGSGVVGLSDWAEQLIAESTGKHGKGILPVVVETPQAPGTRGEDTVFALIGGSLRANQVPGGGAKADVTVNGPLGAQFMAWEYATAVAGRIIEINPFDQPNVTESKENTARILEHGAPTERPTFTEGAIDVYGSPELLGEASTLTSSVAALLGSIDRHGYLAVMAYLDRISDASAAELRPLLARRTEHPVTFGWGPRFLHSTGQYHKGGPRVGRFLQITGAVTDDLPVPGKEYSFGQLQAAQATGDRQAFTTRGPNAVLRLHLTDRKAGLEQLLEALR